MQNDNPRRYLFWVAAAAMLAALATAQFLSIRLECQNWDEGIEISSGYSYLKTGRYRIGPDHPPLERVFAAVPLLFLNPDLPLDRPSWIHRDAQVFGADFLYRNRVPADSILFAARITAILTTLALGLVLALWTRRIFGTAAALGALFLFAFDPNIIAMGRYVKNDILVTLLIFVTVAAWREYLFSRSTRWLIATGIAFGLAAGTKFSAFFLLLVFPIAWFVFPCRSVLRLARTLVILCATALVTLLALYAPAAHQLIPTTLSYRQHHPSARLLVDSVHVTAPPAAAFIAAATQLGLQNHPLLVGLAEFLDNSSVGHQAYLFGKRSETGWWYYFPAAFIVKTPVATLAAIALAGWIVLRRGFRKPGPDWLLPIIPIAVYLPMAMANHVNTGERHLFPIYPFLFMLVASAIAHTRFRFRTTIVAALALLLVIESLSIYPHYTAFFNFTVGGPSAGPRYLVDSNIDWGQDLLKLRTYWIARGRPRLCTLYFGTADQDYYGIQHEPVPLTWQTEQRRTEHCIAAVSVTPLQDVYEQPGALQWLRERTPIAKIGYSIYVYDLSKPER